MAAITLLNAVLQSPRTIRAELSADWVDSEMPEFHIDAGNIDLESVKHADFWEFAESSAYYIDAKYVHFFCSHQVLAQNQLDHGDPVFLAGDFNGWDEVIGVSKWQLKPIEEAGLSGLSLSVPLSEIDFAGGSGFKFVSHEGYWFSIPAGATNIYEDSNDNSNYYIDRNRSGKHLLVVETEQSLGLAQIYYLVMKSGEECSAAIKPGAFFLALESKLSLGAIPYCSSTLFRIFAPRASHVTVVILSDPDGWDDASYYSLILVDDGVWEVVVEENLTGKFYWYRIDGPSEAGFSNFVPEVNILDPYALAVVNRWGPGIVVDKKVYESSPRFDCPGKADLVIGEVHLRDLIAKAPIELSDTDRGGYSGLSAWLQTDNCYLKDWGVNAVELQPIQENDASTKEEYHWGYMPVNYFSPDSGYGRNPLHASQVEEFKTLVDTFHEAGLAVILDVVYNHVGDPAHLEFIDKLYYFELTADGEMSNWSGCGNDLRCNTPMGKRLIIDSLMHLIEFYGVDGFRFDLAELIGLDTLRDIEATVNDKHPDVILIAEPWSFRGHLGSDLKHTSYLSWNDGYRNFLKQYVSGKGDQRSLQYFLRGSPENVGRPYQSINYTESHDDRTWLDDITQNSDFRGDSPTAIDRQRTHLMVSILMMSLGTPMLAQGQDFLRSKWGVTNTYQRGDINALDYQRKAEFSDTHDYFRRWIEFRKSEDAAYLRLEFFPAEGFFEFFPATSGSGMGVLVNALKTCGSRQLFFVVNPMTEPSAIDIGDLARKENWLQLADTEHFDPKGLRAASMSEDSELTMPPVSCALWISQSA
jgi:pullulanase/glycogen debranching enzyme